MFENKDNFEDLVGRYLKSVYNFVFRIIKDKNSAEDITQETFVKVWKNLDKFDSEKNFKTWLFTIARNTTIDYLRKRKNISFSHFDKDDKEDRKFEESIYDTEPLPDEIFMKKELGKELEKALTEIRPDFREIILLHYTEYLTLEQISEVVGKPLNTIKSHHRRGLAALRKLIS